MNELQNLVFCAPSFSGCWSLVHRCFEGRRKQVLITATHVLGSRQVAEHWLYTPARGLDYQVPCLMLSNHSGYERVDTLLRQIEYGVYI
jgi:uncharacterized protein (DUF2384 family)